MLRMKTLHWGENDPENAKNDPKNAKNDIKNGAKNAETGTLRLRD